MDPSSQPQSAARAPAAARLTPRDLGICLLVALGFGPALPVLLRAWSGAEYHAYAFLVPIVAAALALWKRPALARLPARPDARGLGLLAASFALFATGFFAALPTAIGLAVVGAAAGSVLALRGRPHLSELGFPIGYLLFMVPLPRSLVDPAIAELRLLTTDVAVALLQLFALPVMHEGNIVVLPHQRLFVAEACSGVNSVVALLPAAALLGYFRSGFATRTALVASVLPIALFWNLIRLLGTALAALQLPGQDLVTEGPLHELAGILTFGLGCLSLLAVDDLARRIRGGPRRELRASS